MRLNAYKRLFFLAVCAFLLCLVSCNSAVPGDLPETTAAESVEDEVEKMRAYILNASYSDGDSHADALIPELSLKYPASRSSFEDADAAAVVHYTPIGASSVELRYDSSKGESYRLYDVYKNAEGNKQYRIERDSGRLLVYFEEISIEASRGDGYESEAALFENAKEKMRPYCSDLLEGYTSAVQRKMDYGDFTDYYLLWEYCVDGIVVSRVRAVVTDSGAMAKLDLSDYRENAEAISITAGTDAGCREVLDARIASEQAAGILPSGEDVSISIGQGVLRYDEEGRPFVLYTVSLEGQYSLKNVDFAIYIDME